eukprot:TRINITY_DN27461_c0_g1_i1.p1 TRINITY_DN27461_c0_g1~~TRINITY_DN27461_c0_g1_i1.p1  ORF type:complete len:439 (+),score=118.64 TRINITY_DN27461_c0_g1_i1:37-1353(+)
MARAKGVSLRKDDTRRMEEEAKQMEAKLELLRRTMDATDQPAPKGQDSGRWRSGSAAKPLTKGYVRSVMEAPRPKPSKTAGQRAPSTGSRTPVDGTPRQEASQAASLSGLIELGPRSPVAQAAGAHFTFAADLTTGSSGKAASNLQAAMRQQNQDSVEVEAFLGSLKLDRYVSLFMEHGFDCMEVVKEMQDEHMKEIGMAAGHILKLRKHLNELNPPPPQPPVGSASTGNSTQRRVSFGQTEQAPIAAAPQKKASSSSGGYSSSLAEGAFDEQESAASFQEALRAWRDGGDSKAAPAEEAPKGSFWASLGGTEVDLERASTPSKVSSELVSAETASMETQHHDPAPGDEKLCCYQCFKQFYASYAVERTSQLPETHGGGTKRLCSEDCASKWMTAMEAKAEAFKKRQEQLQQMKDMQRALDSQNTATAAQGSSQEETA